ncbi:MAG: DUF928 domain-containing protein [Gammaproteobacteria bacterium]
MKTRALLGLWMLLTLTGLHADFARAADPAPSANAKKSTIAYRPPLRGAPLSRVGGGTRSIRAADLQVEVLAPEDIGFTLQAQPTFFWYCSRAISAPVEFALVRPNVPEPVIEVTLEGPFAAGIHVVDLRDYAAKLEPEVDYEWFISVVFDPAQRSNDVTAGASVRQLGANDGIRSSLPTGTADGVDYAEAGVWYDALAALSANIVSQPTAETPRLQRAELLRQVGLPAAAAAAQ